MALQKKHYVALAIGLVTFTGALAYLQYKRIMNYDWKFKKVKVKTLNQKLVSFDVFLLFTNKSDLRLDIKEQEYKIYINDIYVSRASNGISNIIKAKTTSEIGVNVAFDPMVVAGLLKTNYLSMLANPSAIILKVDIKMKVGLWFLTIDLPISVSFTMKELVDYAKS
jgi:LEA14-like dessication related protein